MEKLIGEAFLSGEEKRKIYLSCWILAIKVWLCKFIAGTDAIGINLNINGGLTIPKGQSALISGCTLRGDSK